MIKKHIYYLVLFPMLVFANPPVPGYPKIHSFDLGLQADYPNITINLATSDLINTGNGGGSGTLNIQDNILSLHFNGSWSAQQMKVGNIKNLNVSPALPNMDLGPILTTNGGSPNGFYAKIENNSLVFYSPFYLSSASANLSTSITGGVSGYSVALPNLLYTCNPTGGGGSGGTVSINNGVVNLNFSGGWSSTCNLKVGQIVYLNTSTITNVELGTIKEGTRDTNYRAKIENNWLVFYMVGTPTLPTSGYMSVSKDLNDSNVLPIPHDKNYHWIHGVSYDSKGIATGSSRSYFDDLGKSDVSLSKDYVTNKIWGTGTTYDNFGKPDKTSFVAPSPLTNFDKTNFLKTNAEMAAGAYPVTLPLNNIAASGQYKASQSITATGTVSPGLTASLTAPTITLSNTFTITATSGSSFIITAANLPDISANPSLANYYSDNNTDEPYQATATHPFAQTNYDTLNPGNVINIVGGNKINGDWKTGYSYTVPAAQEMYYVYGSDYYDGTIVSGKKEVITKFYKSISVDANGVENVAFSDGEGKVLASARSGGTTAYPVVSLIGTQGFVDVHIPAGITSGISLLGGSSLYKIYNLKTGLITTSLTGGNAYRIEAITPPTTDPKTYIDIAGGIPTYDTGALGITYNVNYYDYAVNVYNKTGQLIKTVQPKGYEANSTIKAIPAHMAATATAFISTYTYNALGQVIQASSPDEGTSRFAYRKDGQIRYSQSALNWVTQQDGTASYTDYDSYGRPTQSGLIYSTSGPGIWAKLMLDVDGPIPAGTNKVDITCTMYDETNQFPPNMTLSSVLTAAGIPTANYIQNNLSGNVAATYKVYNDSSLVFDSITWYSYDIYGRVEWIVQYNERIGAKTIHYEYDHKGNVKKVLFQKDKTTESFIHQYTYNANNVLTKVETSTDNTTFITHADYSYYLTGELKRVNIAQGTQGLDYVYTLGGQLKSINHPSLETGKDPGGDSNDVFGLTLDYYNGDYLRTGKNITSSPTIGADYNGNIKAARWANKGIAGDYNGTTANQKGYLYTYDRNNFLTNAAYGNANSSDATISPASSYKEGNLAYDANGNLKTLQRTNDAGTMQDDLTYAYNTDKNQLNSVADAAGSSTNPNDIGTQTVGNYQYDAIGQITRNVLENIDYSYDLQGLVIQVNKAGRPAVRFYYNERGQRIKKESYNTASPYNLTNTDYYILDLSGDVMAIYNRPNGSSAIVQKDLPIFGLSRLGVYNRASGTSTYEITDHLGNVRAVVQKNTSTGTTDIKSFADYYPFGEQLPGRNSNSGNYRYAFQGQEKDSETEMEAFQLRLWDGRLGRWLSPDPYGQYSSPYLGMGNNPISMTDLDGGYSWAGAFLRWAGGGFEGRMHQSNEYGDWGINKPSNNTTFDPGDGGVGIQGYTDYGSKRIDFKNRDFNFGGAGAGGMSLFGTNPDVNSIPDLYIEGHVAATQGSVGLGVKVLGANFGLKGEVAKSPIYQVGFDFDSSRGELDGGEFINTSTAHPTLGDSFGGGVSYGGGVDVKFDAKTGYIKEVTTSAIVVEITNEFNTSRLHRGEISRTKMGFNFGAEAALFFGVEASFKTGFIFPSQKH